MGALKLTLQGGGEGGRTKEEGKAKGITKKGRENDSRTPEGFKNQTGSKKRGGTEKSAALGRLGRHRQQNARKHSARIQGCSRKNTVKGEPGCEQEERRYKGALSGNVRNWCPAKQKRGKEVIGLGGWGEKVRDLPFARCRKGTRGQGFGPDGRVGDRPRKGVRRKIKTLERTKKKDFEKRRSSAGEGGGDTEERCKGWKNSKKKQGKGAGRGKGRLEAQGKMVTQFQILGTELGHFLEKSREREGV